MNIKNLSIIFLIFFSFSSFSAVILKIKGQKALIDLEGARVQKGDKFDALNLYGKSKGLIEIQKAKKGKAIGILRKGKMGTSWILEPTTSSATSDDNPQPLPVNYTEPTTSKPPTIKKRRSSFNSYSSHTIGVLVGPHLNFVRLSSTSKNASGVGWRGSVMADFTFTQRLSTRVSLGWQTLVIEGQRCEQITNCKLSIQYPNAGALLKLKFFKYAAFNSWIGVGGSLLWPIPDKRKNMELDKKSFNGFHGSLTVALGTDIQLQNIHFPVQIDMNWINPVVISFNPLQDGARSFKPRYIGLQLGISFSL